MERHALLAMLFLLSLLVLNGSDASFIWEHRKLGSKDNKNNNKTETPPHDSPPPSQKKPDPNPVVGGETTKSKEEPKGSNSNNTISPDPTPLPKVGNEKGNHQKESKNSAPTASAPPLAKKDGDRSPQQEKKKEEGETVAHSITSETCDGLQKCTAGDMVACIFKIDPKYLTLLIQNIGNDTIKAKPLQSNLGDIEVGKHQTKAINMSVISSETIHLAFNAGKGDCVLHMDKPAAKGNFFLRLPSFDNILTPVNGAYFLIFTVLVFGGTLACCKLRKKRHDEVPYQELEMALPESVSATHVESAEAWDQGWDDDWDDNVGTKSPPAHLAGSISANGLTSRSANKDGWENNWDD